MLNELVSDKNTYINAYNNIRVYSAVQCHKYINPYRENNVRKNAKKITKGSL